MKNFWLIFGFGLERIFFRGRFPFWLMAWNAPGKNKGFLVAQSTLYPKTLTW